MTGLLALLATSGSAQAKPAMTYVPDVSATDDVPVLTWGVDVGPVQGTVAHLGGTALVGVERSQWEFVLIGDAATLELSTSGSAYSYAIWVDGRLAVDSTDRAEAAGVYRVSLTWLAASTRRVRIDTLSVTGVTVTTPEGQSALATTAQWRVAIVGDSYIQMGYGARSIAQQVGARLSNANVGSFGRGGTGYEAASPYSHYSSPSRMAYLGDWAPDIVVGTGSWTDGTGPGFESYVEQFWYRSIALPSRPLVLTIGPQHIFSGTINDERIRLALSGRPRYLGHASPAEWLQPSDTDGTAHPSRTGIETWGDHIAQALVALQP